MSATYRGRFAPSPTGPLHLGSLLAAVGSYLQARAHNGRWLLRIEDIDPPRQPPDAVDRILRSLEAHGLHWDEAVWYQSRRGAAYEASLDRLHRAGWLYACACSRKQIGQVARRGAAGMIYPGTCRNAGLPLRPGLGLRLRSEGVIGFHDRLQGEVRQDLAQEIGDILLRRPDGLYNYQLAVVVDDAAQGITEVVRGHDLLVLTPAQIHLQRLLQLPTPDYLHLPLLVDATGHKLSKQTGARALDDAQPAANLRRVLHWLGLLPHKDEPASANVTELLDWAVAHWDTARLPQTRITLPRENTTSY